MLFGQYSDNPDFRIDPKFMSGEALSEMLSARPVLNADVVFYNRTEHAVYLPVRKSRPAEGIWVIGGALKAGEQPVETLVRRVSKETTLSVAPERFEYLGIINFVWSYRKEPAETDGRHDYNFVYALEMTAPEIQTAAAHLDPEEYEANKGLLAFHSRSELEAAGARKNILDYFQAIFPEERADSVR